jgi:hypothetical protein
MAKEPPRYRNIDISDGKTGELIGDHVPMLVPRKQRLHFEGEWIAMPQGPLMELAKARRSLGVDGYSVLLGLTGKIDFENLIIISQAELGRELGMCSQNVQRAIKKLIEMEIMFEGPRVGIHRSYRWNPNYGWKGSAKNHRKALDERMQKAGFRLAADNGKALIEQDPSEDEDERQSNIFDVIEKAEKDEP